MAIIEVTVPDIGHFTGVEVIEVAIKPGTVVKAEDTLITLETEKASMDVPSPVSGTITKMKIKLGDKVSQGDVIALIEVQDKPDRKSKNDEAKISSHFQSHSFLPTPMVSISEEVMVSVPDLGDAKHVIVVAVDVKSGDEVAQNQLLLKLKSNQGTIEIPSPFAGKIGEVLVRVGENVTTHDPILTMNIYEGAQPQVELPQIMQPSTEQPQGVQPSGEQSQGVQKLSLAPLEALTSPPANAVPEAPAAKPEAVAAKPEAPVVKPEAPAAKPAAVQNSKESLKLQPQQVDKETSSPHQEKSLKSQQVTANEQVINVPDTGGSNEVEVIEVAVKPGDTVALEDTLITLESEKASMDIPSPYHGKVKSVLVKVGDKVGMGDPIVVLLAEGATSPPASEPTQSVQTEAEQLKIQPQTENDTPSQQSTNEQVINVPDTGGSNEVEVIEVAVKPGDTIALEDTLITLESEKASMDIPSPYHGKVKSVLVKVGDKVGTGDPIVVLLPGTASAPKQPIQSVQSVSRIEAPSAPMSRSVTSNLQPEQSHETSLSSSSIHAGPATRRLARELGVDLALLKGSGHKNRIVTKDVHDFVKAVMKERQAPAAGLAFGIEKPPEIDFSQFGDIEVKPLSRIKKWTGKNLYRNWITIPHITQFDEADITELEAFRQEHKQLNENTGIKLTPLPFIIKGVLSALRTFPQFNASLASNGADLIFKKYFNIGIAVDTPNGLVVPVLKNVDTKGLFDLAQEIGELSNQAREGKLKTDQMQGACFTISSLGSIGGTAFTPIINAPDVAILGVSKVQIKPVYINNKFVPRRMLPLSLSYDHRVIDGVEGAKFCAHLVAQLQDIRKLLL